MPKPVINGGYILLSRKLIESEIMSKPPLYLKVWVWLLLNAQHSEYKNLKRGENKTSTTDIINAMTYKIGYRTVKPTKKEIFGIINWLRNPHEGTDEGPMMATTKVTQGFVYKVLNYSVYQDPKNYEGINEGLTKVSTISNGGNNKDKNVTRMNKNEKNVKKEVKVFVTPTSQEVKDYCKERDNAVDSEKFVDFYSAKGWMIGKNKVKDWKACVRTWEKNNQGTNKGNNVKTFAEMAKEEMQREELYNE